MNVNAIVYTSNTGYTARYAGLLGKRTGLPVYSLVEAGAKLPAGNCVIYLGWLMAGKIQGYAKAAKRYRIAAVCGVGMGPGGSQLADVRNFTDLKGLRAKALYDEDQRMALRKSHENPLVKQVYAEYLGSPGSERAHQILHTSYTVRSYEY